MGAAGRLLDFDELLFCGVEKFIADPCATDAEEWIAAGDKEFFRSFGAGDGEEITLVEELHLEACVVGQLLDRGESEAADPVDVIGLQISLVMRRNLWPVSFGESLDAPRMKPIY